MQLTTQTHFSATYNCALRPRIDVQAVRQFTIRQLTFRQLSIHQLTIHQNQKAHKNDAAPQHCEKQRFKMLRSIVSVPVGKNSVSGYACMMCFHNKTT
jgi:hypothetical protein